MKLSNEFKIICLISFFALFLYCLYYLRDILTPVFISMLIAYILDPVVDILEKRFSRTFSIILLILLSLIGLTIIILFVIPAFVAEFNKLLNSFPDYIKQFNSLIGKASIFVDKLQISAKKIFPHTLKILNNLINNTFSIISNILNLLLLPVFTFYFLKEFDNIRLNALEKIPPKFRNYVVEVSKKIDSSVSSFVRGQLVVCIILAILYSAGLLLIKIDMALIIGIFSGFASIIPYFGFITGILFSILIAFIQYHTVSSILSVLIVFGIVQALESFLITPKILGDKVGLHPVIVILSLMIFGKIFGFIGLIIAIPLASTLKVFYNEAMEYYKKSHYFK